MWSFNSFFSIKTYFRIFTLVNKPLLQRNILFSLALLIFLNSAGIFMYVYLDTGIHRVMEKEKKNTETLLLSVQEFRALTWIGKRDFIYNDKVYDCDRLEIADGKIRIGCHADKKETKFKNFLADEFRQSKDPLKARKKELIKSILVFPFTSGQLIPFVQNESPLTFSTLSGILLPAQTRLDSPPPELV
jgi:hypothetical protein